MQLHYLKLNIKCDLPMLSPYLSKKLNPLQVLLVSVKDIPFHTEPKYKPIYAEVEFVDGQRFKTEEMPQQSACRFMHKHVFLVGKHDPVMFREMLATNLVRVYLHDCDEFVNEDADAVFSVGKASFNFKDFLRPYCKELKLRSDVFPTKKPEIDTTTNLDLNTTARKNEKTIEKFSPYLMNATYTVMLANLTHPIGSFDHEKEMALLSADSIRESQKTVGEEVKSGRVTGDQDRSPSKQGGEEAAAAELPDEEPIEVEEISDWNGAIFERMIIIVPYKSPDTVKAIEASFERINLTGLNLENSRYLNTKELSEEERNDRTIDFLGGFEIMDSEFRMFIIEGLGGKGRGMDLFYR